MEVGVVVDVNRVASGFVSCFPGMTLDRAALRDAATSLTTGRDVISKLGAFGFALMLSPPVDRLLIPFTQAMLVAAAEQLGASRSEAEQLAAGVLDELVAGTELPLAGLVVGVGAPRSGRDIAALRDHDTFIEHLHDAVKTVGGRSIGPREHPADHDDEGPANQWPGHVQRDCEALVSHDVLVVVSGASVGVGESLAVARALRIPVVAVELAEPDPAVQGSWRVAPGPCRLRADGQVVLATVREGLYVADGAVGGHEMSEPGVAEPQAPEGAARDVSGDAGVAWPTERWAADLADEVVACLRRLTPVVRARQRERFTTIANLAPYRRYLSSGLDGAAAVNADGFAQPVSQARVEVSSAVANPFRFAAMGEAERDRVAGVLERLSRDDFATYSRLPSPARSGFDEFVSVNAPMSRLDQGWVLREGERELLLDAVDTRARRHADWTSAQRWERVWASRTGTR